MIDLDKISGNPKSYKFQYSLTERYRMGQYTSAQIWQLYRVNRSLLHKWNCRYWRHYLSPSTSYFNMKSKPKSDKALIKELKAQNKRLKEELAQQELSARMYKRMIEIAEEKFEISIEKKSGAKRSRNSGGSNR
ncbi:MAG: hypothetical protein AAF696_29630 [Bacteroidota bacterium]